MVFASKFTQQQVLAILDEYVAGTSREVLCDRYGITRRTFFRWKASLGRNRPALEQRLAAAERENEALRNRLKEVELGGARMLLNPREANVASSVFSET